MEALLLRRRSRSLPMSVLLVVVMVVVAVAASAAASASVPRAATPLTGRALWLSDIHFDSEYVVDGSSLDMCHKSKDTPSKDACAAQGNYNADVPYTLLRSALEALQKAEPQPDFIVWTGDAAPHVSKLSAGDVLAAVVNITAELRALWPTTPIFPAVGNHDVSPTDTVDAGPNESLDGLATAWSTLLEPAALQTLLQGGYYTQLVAPGLRVVSLNTILYLAKNPDTADQLDPAGQLAWLRATLHAAAAANESVWLLAHAAPGIDPKTMSPALYLDDNQALLEVLASVLPAPTVVLQLYAHAHRDTFRVFADPVSGDPVSPVLLMPSLTPWSKVGDDDSQNPSIRVLSYDTASMHLLDYEHYYTDLADDLQNGDIQWHLEYSFAQAYAPYLKTAAAAASSPSSPSSSSLPRITGATLSNLAYQIAANDSLLADYMTRFTAGFLDYSSAGAGCGKSCRTKQVCSMLYLAIDRFNDCLSNGPQSS